MPDNNHLKEPTLEDLDTFLKDNDLLELKVHKNELDARIERFNASLNNKLYDSYSVLSDFNQDIERSKTDLEIALSNIGKLIPELEHAEKLRSKLMASK